MRIKFTRDYTVQAHDGPTYREGQIEDMADRAALHFINRNAAVEITDEEPKASEPETSDEEPETSEPETETLSKGGKKDRFKGKAEKAAKRFKNGQDEHRKKQLEQE